MNLPKQGTYIKTKKGTTIWQVSHVSGTDQNMMLANAVNGYGRFITFEQFNKNWVKA